MKKFLALALAIVMMMAMAVPAFAAPSTIDEENYAATTNDTGSVKVTYTVEETYEISFPIDVNFEEADQEATHGYNFDCAATITATDVKLAGNKTLNVAVATANTAEYKSATKTWFLVDEDDGSDDVAYFVLDDADENVANEQTILSVTTAQGDGSDLSGTDDSASLTFVTNGTAQVGTYSDTLTFTVSFATT